MQYYVSHIFFSVYCDERFGCRDFGRGERPAVVPTAEGCPAGFSLLAYWGFFRVAAAMRKEKALIGYGFSGGVNAAGTQRG